MAERRKQRRLWGVLIALGLLGGISSLTQLGQFAHGQPKKDKTPEILRWSHHIPKDSKPLQLFADSMATWVEGGRRIILLRGNVWLEQGIVHMRMQEGVVWVDELSKRQTGIFRIDVYAEGNVQLEDGPKSMSGRQALVDLSTRGEVKLKAYKSKLIQRAFPNDPVYLRAKAIRFPAVAQKKSTEIERTSHTDKKPGPLPKNTQSSTMPPDIVPEKKKNELSPIQQASFTEIDPGDGTGVKSTSQQPTRPPLPWPPPPVTGATDTITNPPTTRPADTTIVPPSAPPKGGTSVGPPVGGTLPVMAPTTAPPDTPPRQVSIVPRNAAPIDLKNFPMPNGEFAVVVTGGVILTVRNQEEKVGLVDIEADKLVFWTRNNPQNMFNRLRSPQGQSSKELEFYLAGNVEIRQQAGKDNRLLRADQVFYDVGRNVAVALRADLEFRQPGIPEPIHMKAEELYQLSLNQYRVVRAEVFSSRLPSDPGLKVVVAEATLEEKKVPRKTIFGRPVIDRKTGQQEMETQQLFDGKEVLFKVEDFPVFYLPFLKGDVNEPLGPLRAVSFNYNRIFGFQTFTTLNVYELFGMNKVAGTKWDLHLDYMTSRGPALGTTFDYAGKNLFEIPNNYVGQVKAYGIYDTGTDILGGQRGQFDHHPDFRGRFFWKQSLQDMPCGFSVLSQVSALSDKNFLEQYYKREFDLDPNQETFLYVKQQQDNWAWTGLAEQRIRNWVTETSWLPRADGYLLGQDLLNLVTYNAHASAGYAQLRTTEAPPPAYLPTDKNTNTGRFDLWQEVSLPFYLGPFKMAPYLVGDLTYYTDDLAGNDRGRLYGAAGLRASVPMTRLYPEVQSELLNVSGINHKILLGANYYLAQSNTSYTTLPQLDRMDDDATDQARRDIRPIQPFINPSHGLFLATSPLFDPQVYALRRLVDNRIDTLDTIEVLQAEIRQRWQTKRGYPGAQHIIDWMTLDLSGSFFPHSKRDNFGENFAFLEYDWNWNVGDRTALTSTGWVDPITNGPRVFTIGAFYNRSDRTSLYLGFRDIEPVQSRAVSGAVTYIFSPKYALTASAVYDFGVAHGSIANSLLLTRMGSDFQVSLGFNYNATLGNFGVIFEIVPNLVPMSKRVPTLAGMSPHMVGM